MFISFKTIITEVITSAPPVVILVSQVEFQEAFVIAIQDQVSKKQESNETKSVFKSFEKAKVSVVIKIRVGKWYNCYDYIHVVMFIHTRLINDI